MVALCHPRECELLRCCCKLDLSDSDIELLRDLLGWNNVIGTMPKSYRGIEPLVSMASNATKEDRKLAQAITQLMLRILGNELATAVKVNPQILQKQLGLPRLSAVWLVSQLHPRMNLRKISKKWPGIYSEIYNLLVIPEYMPNIVGITMEIVLSYRMETM